MACCARMAAASRVCSVASSCVQLSCISLSAASFWAQTSERRALTIMKFCVSSALSALKSETRRRSELASASASAPPPRRRAPSEPPPSVLPPSPPPPRSAEGGESEGDGATSAVVAAR